MSKRHDFFELLDCVINTLYSDHNICYLPIFQEFVEDLNKSLLLHGIDYIIYEGQLVYRTEKTIFESAIDPCFYSLKRHKLLDADKYLHEAFNSFKKKWLQSSDSAIGYGLGKYNPKHSWT